MMLHPVHVRKTMHELILEQARAEVEQGPYTLAAMHDAHKGRREREAFQEEKQISCKIEPLRMQNIKDGVEAYCRMGLTRLHGPPRSQASAWRRQVAMYLCRHLLHKSYPIIGHEYKLDHTTVMFGCDRVKTTMRRDPVTADEINRVQLQVLVAYAANNRRRNGITS